VLHYIHIVRPPAGVVGRQEEIEMRADLDFGVRANSAAIAESPFFEDASSVLIFLHEELCARYEHKALLPLIDGDLDRYYDLIVDVRRIVVASLADFNIVVDPSDIHVDEPCPGDVTNVAWIDR
jgi:hypothetical protein